ncbi:MAG: tRNA (N6-isopentenyl adenosine(37)-C2)-methylthiotransferase MiaB [Armatimonadetes bacterium]|nr:tRNA (N6-isopentenyl adenosine(37)-C2)-methylthiotransferase MiaB [Armatimonadota bacterium]
MPRKLYIETYGCQMNVADSQLIAGSLAELGYESTPTAAEADVILVNTCAIRENAEVRVWGRLAQLAAHKKERPSLTLGIVGCMAQHLKDKIQSRAPEVDLVVGPDAYRRLGDILLTDHDEPFIDVRLDKKERYEGLDPATDNGVTAFLTIMRGCDKFCTFCIVPFVRGRERSLEHDEIVRAAEALAARGVKEITLLGQTVNAWRDGQREFADLLRSLDGVAGLTRIRFTSPHPADFTPRSIAAMAACEKVMPSLHLPLQSASDAVLERMNRGYTYAEYRRLVDRFRAEVPGLALTTDLIAGFPGETDQDFAATLACLEELRFDAAFMFKYSPRSGTRAYELEDDVPEAQKTARLEQIIARQEAISAELNAAAVGQETEVLVEGRARRGNGWYGRNPQFKNTVFHRAAEPAPGELVVVQITGSTAHTLMGEAV